MSNPQLPAELLDLIVDHLHDAYGALMNCCLVATSWIPRTRTHLFADIRFRAEEGLESWKMTFPDITPSSPARYTKTLRIDCPHVITAADVEAGGWIRCFSQVVQLELGSQKLYVDESDLFLSPLQRFSHVVKSLLIDSRPLHSSQIFHLILSFPLLEDLTVINPNRAMANDDGGSDDHPSNPPAFTGSLQLMVLGVRPLVRRLLSLPGGIHFRKLMLTFYRQDTPLITALVEGCSHTLETLDIICDPYNQAAAIDLSKARKLRDVIFRPASMSVEWITMALQTTTPDHRELQKISIHLPSYSSSLDVDVFKQSATYEQWPDLDRLLVQLWESRSIRPKVIRTAWGVQRLDRRGLTECLLPELTRRGVVDLVE